MAPDDAALLAYIKLPLGDRRAIARLLAPSKRRALHERLQARVEFEKRKKECARNPAMLLSCNPALSKHLLAVACEAPRAPPATEKARAAIRAVIEQHSAVT